ncbi:MAG: carboxypeptidase-like regulatory domain-containing protein [Saprospiraceae bacterium]|nr:carboxypeptidase-like regulatory domain-containing protein [Saprospiraceae bacterium]
MKITNLISTLIFLNFATTIHAQITQILRGTILDKQSESPLVGAAVQVKDFVPMLGAVTDENGNFAIKNVPTGRYTLVVSFIGYNNATLPNIVVNAGKETVLTLNLEESVTKLDAVVVSGKVEKTATNNELATISARQFNVEEVQRFSGGRGDVSRLAANFAGVAIANDSRNDIVIRGNSPTGVLWRLEGVPIPNPNHFSTLGTTGGPVSALNPNMIRNSDFMTSAFPAEYGNATAGVFDIGLRKGNREKFETTIQLGAFTGLEGMVEGPLSKKGKDGQNGAFVVAYRHSFVELAQKAGINVGTSALPLYKDLTFNLDLAQTKLGKFSIFGLGATSSIDFLSDVVDSADVYAVKNQDAYAASRLGVLGVRHNLIINPNTYIRTVVSGSYSGNTYNEYRDKGNELKRHQFDANDQQMSYRVSSFINKKFSAKLTTRTGFLYQNLGLDINTRDRTNSPDWIPVRKFDGAMNLLEAYNQTQFKPSDLVTINGGVHVQYLDINKTSAIEPRLAVNYHISPKQSLNIGYGLHTQMQPLPVFFFEEKQADGTFKNLNRDLDFTKSHHFVLGYDLKPSSDWHVKAEIYYQILRGVPVEKKLSSFSMLNTGADFGFPQIGSLINTGEGKNAGIELTIEKFFSKGWYMLGTASLFDSKYKGSDGIERNTAFNGKYVANILAGKEIKFGKSKKNAFTFDTKFTTAGGRPFTPIDLVASKAAGREVRDWARPFSENLDNYLRWDVKLGVTMNSAKRKFTQTFFLDFQNVTSRRNVFSQSYSVAQNRIYKTYQIGFFPDVLWRVQF